MENPKNNEKLVIVDFGMPELGNNKIFDYELAFKVSHTLAPLAYLYAEARKSGITLVTPDVYSAMPDKPEHVLLISHLYSNQTEKLLDEGVQGTILFCLESPFVATRFYLGLKIYSQKFKHSLLFSGMERQASKKSKFKEIFFPQAYEAGSFTALPFADKKLLTLVSSAKGMDNWRKNVLLKLFYGFAVKEIYKERRRAINFFSGSGDFDLYGFGWDRALFADLDATSIKACYRGPVVDKIQTMRSYRFALCFENAVFPGYVTEKIFDAMYAGCIPVYYGAPDIGNYVDEGAFVDLRKFKDYAHLRDYISKMGESEYDSYIKAIRAYVMTDKYEKFSQKYYASQILDILKEEFKSDEEN